MTHTTSTADWPTRGPSSKVREQNETGEDSRSENTSDQLFVAIESKTQHHEEFCSTPSRSRKRPMHHQIDDRSCTLSNEAPSGEQSDRLLTLYEVAVDMLSYDNHSGLLEGKCRAASREMGFRIAQPPSSTSPAAKVAKGRHHHGDSRAGTPGRRRSRSELHGPCDHCGVTDSPQWRKGPKFKPVLCNACGTRFLRNRTLGKQTTKGSKGNAAQSSSCPASKPVPCSQEQTVPESSADNPLPRDQPSALELEEQYHPEQSARPVAQQEPAQSLVVDLQDRFNLPEEGCHRQDVLPDATYPTWLLQRLSTVLNSELLARCATASSELPLRPGWLAATSPTLLASSLNRMQPEPAGAILSLLSSMMPAGQFAPDVSTQLQSLLLSQTQPQLLGDPGAGGKQANADAISMQLQLLLAAQQSVS